MDEVEINEQIENTLKDLDSTAKNLCEKLMQFGLEQAKKQMSVTEKNTKLLDEVIVYQTEMTSTLSTALIAGEGVVRTITKLRNAWGAINQISKEDMDKIIDESKKNVAEILMKKHNIKLDKKEVE
jgi:hypothetical protein